MSQGILFRHRKCMVCNKYLDDAVKKKPALRHEDDDNALLIDPFTEHMTLYECGHAFHVKCIERHIEN